MSENLSSLFAPLLIHYFNSHSLQERVALEWGSSVKLVFSDMRSFYPREKADIIVSELLGSFGDNELSPECLDGVMRCLKREFPCSSCFSPHSLLTGSRTRNSRRNLHSLFLHLLPRTHHLFQAARRSHRSHRRWRHDHLGREARRAALRRHVFSGSHSKCTGRKVGSGEDSGMLDF